MTEPTKVAILIVRLFGCLFVCFGFLFYLAGTAELIISETPPFPYVNYPRFNQASGGLMKVGMIPHLLGASVWFVLSLLLWVSARRLGARMVGSSLGVPSTAVAVLILRTCVIVFVYLFVVREIAETLAEWLRFVEVGRPYDNIKRILLSHSKSCFLYVISALSLWMLCPWLARKVAHGLGAHLVNPSSDAHSTAVAVVVLRTCVIVFVSLRLCMLLEKVITHWLCMVQSGHPSQNITSTLLTSYEWHIYYVIFGLALWHICPWLARKIAHGFNCKAMTEPSKVAILIVRLIGSMSICFAYLYILVGIVRMCRYESLNAFLMEAQPVHEAGIYSFRHLLGVSIWLVMGLLLCASARRLGPRMVGSSSGAPFTAVAVVVLRTCVILFVFLNLCTGFAFVIFQWLRWDVHNVSYGVESLISDLYHFPIALSGLALWPLCPWLARRVAHGLDARLVDSSSSAHSTAVVVVVLRTCVVVFVALFICMWFGNGITEWFYQVRVDNPTHLITVLFSQSNLSYYVPNALVPLVLWPFCPWLARRIARVDGNAKQAVVGSRGNHQD